MPTTVTDDDAGSRSADDETAAAWGLACDLVAEARHLVRLLDRPDAPLLDPVEQAVTVCRAAQTLTAVLVVRATCRGPVGWARLGPALDVWPDAVRLARRTEVMGRPVALSARLGAPVGGRRPERAPEPCRLSGQAAGPGATTGAGPRSESWSRPETPSRPRSEAQPRSTSSSRPQPRAGAAGTGSVPRPRSHLAPVLARLHRAAGLTLDELADRLGVAASQASRILSGEDFPGWPVTERFARACGADAVVLRKVWEDELPRERRSCRSPADAHAAEPDDVLHPPYGHGVRPDRELPPAVADMTPPLAYRHALGRMRAVVGEDRF